MFSLASQEISCNFFDENDTNLFNEPPKLESFFVNDPCFKNDIVQLQASFNDRFQITEAENKFPIVPDLFARSNNILPSSDQIKQECTTPNKPIVIKMHSSSQKRISKQKKWTVNFHGHIFSSKGLKESIKSTEKTSHLNEFSLENLLRQKALKKL